jgi:acyl-CoA reductase-like NAD-dependent aldehyde dehydrogenase
MARSLYIDGSWRGSDQEYERFDPSHPEHLTGTFSAATPGQVREAYSAAAAAQVEWREASAQSRAGILRTAADALERRAAEAASTLTSDMGKAIRDAGAEVLRSIEILRYYAGELLQASGAVYPSAVSATTILTVEHPLGVVCAITPWNFPFAIPTWKLAPAIGFGNAVVWKPAEAASGSAKLLTEVFEEAGLPAGVLNLITGSGTHLSPALTGDRALAALTFTGSNAVGRRLRESVADRNVKVQLELGGKNPAIVLADADLPDAATQIARGAMLATGQRCTATSRVYVEDAIGDRFTELLVERVDDLVVGDPQLDETEVGPLASAEQRDNVASYLELARVEGVEVLTGGSMMEGCFVEPTVLSRVEPQSRLVTEEIFGPVLVLERVPDWKAAIASANQTEFGLSSAVFTRDLGTALAFLRETESGLVHVNRETAGVEPHVPFGGIKESSSMSREQGTAAREFFTTTKTAYLRVP